MNNIKENFILNNHIDSLCDLYIKGRFYTVIQRAKKLLIRYKDSVAILNILGMSNAKINKHEDAIDNYKKAIELNPDNATTFFHLGILYHDLNQYNKAIKYYKKAISNNPSYIDAVFNIAYAYIELEDNISAKKYLNKIKNIHHSNLSILLKVIFLCKFDEIGDYKLLYDRYCSILNKEEKTKKFINLKKQVSVSTLIGFGRSGSLFLHSLLDGHPQISTLPGYFFKGWFGEQTWPIFQPNYEDINWRETLVEKICSYFEPQFNAHCKKNVIGEPHGNTKWFAKNLGFTQLGENQSEVLELDQQKFKSKFLDLSQTYDKIDSRICFELIHKAFDKAYRIPEDSSQKEKTIFYHLHNPDHFEYANFMRNYPNSRVLYILRNPIQMLESWILLHYKKLQIEKDQSNSIEIYHRIYDKIYYLFEFINNPLNSIFENQIRGVKLEDIKMNPNQTIPLISNWIGIKNYHTLYKSEFLNKKYSRPSENFNNISGFDLSAIKAKEGRFFGEMDIIILKTLLWPLLREYKYTSLSEKEFKINLKKIKKNLKKPMKFEQKIYSLLPDNQISLSQMEPHKKLHKILFDNHQTLSMSFNFRHIIKPLI